MTQNKGILLGTWTTNIIIDGKRFLGELVITNDAMHLTAKYNMSLFDTSAPAFFIRHDNNMVCKISPEDIVSVTSKTSLLNKRIILLAKDATEKTHDIILDYGIMSINSMLDALNKLKEKEESL